MWWHQFCLTGSHSRTDTHLHSSHRQSDSGTGCRCGIPLQLHPYRTVIQILPEGVDRRLDLLITTRTSDFYPVFKLLPTEQFLMQRWPDAKSGIMFYCCSNQSLLDSCSACSAHKLIVLVESFPLWSGHLHYHEHDEEKKKESHNVLN